MPAKELAYIESVMSSFISDVGHHVLYVSAQL